MTTLPTIHLNGSGADNLYNEYKASWNAVRAATTALVNATCNARDFYPQGDIAFQQARNERRAALEHLEAVEEYLADWVTHCADYVRYEDQ